MACLYKTAARRRRGGAALRVARVTVCTCANIGRGEVTEIVCALCPHAHTPVPAGARAAPGAPGPAGVDGSIVRFSGCGYSCRVKKP